MATERCKTCGTWNILRERNDPSGNRCPECEEKKRIDAKIATYKKAKKEKDKEI